MNSYFLVGAPPAVLFRLIRRHGVGTSMQIMGRLLFLSQNALWTAILKRRECAHAPDDSPSSEDPIIIVGHYRTGSTYLHQLLNRDPGLVAPSLLQCTYPECFNAAKPFASKIVARFLPSTRTFDNVRLSIDSPQEDEYALLRMGVRSILEEVVFPGSGEYALMRKDPAFNGEDPSVWAEALQAFVNRVSASGGGRRVVLKNPLHSYRIGNLTQLYPNARFIHICRHPYEMVPSTVRMWNVVGRENALRGQWRPPILAEVARGAERMYRKLEEGLGVVSRSHKYCITYESLSSNPEEQLRRIYDHFGLTISPKFKSDLTAFLRENRGYRPNAYTLSPVARDTIRRHMGEYMRRCGYK